MIDLPSDVQYACPVHFPLKKGVSMDIIMTLSACLAVGIAFSLLYYKYVHKGADQAGKQPGSHHPPSPRDSIPPIFGEPPPKPIQSKRPPK